MNNKMVASWVSLAMVLSFIVIIIEVAPVVEAPTTWYVDDVPGSGSGNPAEDYISIQDAINASSDGDTVFVYNGTYYENVIVNKTINLTGENKSTTTINGGGSENVVKIEVNLVNILGFTITNSGSVTSNAGLYIDSNYNVIFNNNIYLNKKGIFVTSSSNNNIIIYNKISNNDSHGINLQHSSNNQISSNSVTNNLNGIVLDDSYNNYNNLINNNVHWNTWYGISLWMSLYNNIIDNNVSNNNEGIRIRGTSNNNNVSNNIILSSGSYGIDLVGSSDNVIINNNVLFGNNDGFNIINSHNNIIVNNTIFSNNQRGIYSQISSKNRIVHNNFISNGIQAHDDGFTNFWNDTYPSGGNYWSDYTGNDYYKGPNQNIPGNDGIGDIPYTNISGAAPQDNYPLMQPYISLENYTILKQGWNLISIPLIQEEQNLTRVLGSIHGWYNAVQWYDVTGTTDLWKHQKVTKPFGNDLSKINETMGFWIYITQPEDTIFIYNGTQPTVNQTIPLYPGWNLVGYPSLTNHNRTEGLNNLTFDTHVDTILTYNASTQTWKKLDPSDYFEVGRGYWVHAITKCVWEVPL